MSTITMIQASIRVYQQTLSPDHGLLKALFPAGVCRFDPTCSEYMHEALKQHGWRGLLLGLRRLTRCHPLAPGGHDPVP
jgi:putative membrane protein insertion efficiency factor